MITEKESRIIYYIKAFAIFSVVCAHISLVPENFSTKSQYMCAIINEIGAIGVGLFFCVSGFVFRRKTEVSAKFLDFLHRKSKGIMLPWFVSSTLVYLYVAIRKGGSISGYIFSIVGYMSSYWYLTVLMVCYLVFFAVRKSRKEVVLSLLIAFTCVISVYLRYSRTINQDSIGVYLNIFNWFVFFAMGYLAGKVDACKLNRVLVNKWGRVTASIASISLLIIPYIFADNKFSYFAYWYIPAEIIICYAIISICTVLGERKIRILTYLGKMSFAIYLYNELVWAGLVVNIGNRFDSILLLLLRPLLVIFAVCFELEIGRWLFGKIKKENLFGKLTGVRVK